MSSVGFTRQEMTASVDLLPNKYPFFGGPGFFPVTSRKTRLVYFDIRDGNISIIDPTPVGAKGTSMSRDLEKMVAVVVPHYKIEDNFLAEEVQGQRRFGSETELRMPADELIRMQMKARDYIDQTVLYAKTMALVHGKVFKADGVTELANYYTLTGETRKPAVDFDLGNPDSDLKAHCKEVLRHIEKHARGLGITGVEVGCSPEWFDAFDSHPKLKEAFERRQARYLSDDNRKEGIKFGGLVFREVSGIVTDPKTSNTIPFIPSGKAIAYPTGPAFEAMTELVVAPASYWDTANKPGKLYNPHLVLMRSAEGWDYTLQSNFLPVIKRPNMIVELISNS